LPKEKIPALTFADSENNHDLNPNVSSTVSATKTAHPNRLRQKKFCGALASPYVALLRHADLP
jgi:hypothetical protein